MISLLSIRLKTLKRNYDPFFICFAILVTIVNHILPIILLGAYCISLNYRDDDDYYSFTKYNINRVNGTFNSNFLINEMKKGIVITNSNETKINNYKSEKYNYLTQFLNFKKKFSPTEDIKNMNNIKIFREEEGDDDEIYRINFSNYYSTTIYVYLILFCNNLIRIIADEKENKVDFLLKLKGVSKLKDFFSWFLIYMFISFWPIAFFIIILVVAEFSPFIILFIFLYIINIYLFSYFCLLLFSNKKAIGIFVQIINFISLFLVSLVRKGKKNYINIFCYFSKY